MQAGQVLRSLVNLRFTARHALNPVLISTPIGRQALKKNSASLGSYYETLIKYSFEIPLPENFVHGR